VRTMLERLNAEIGILKQSHTDTSGVVGAATWCTIDNITLKQIFLKPDSCDSCGHSFLVSDSQYTSANHDFVSDSVIGIDIDADKGDGNGPKEIRMDDIPITQSIHPPYRMPIRSILEISFLYLVQGDTHPPTYPATPTP